ncbi:MAG: prenyltransferase [Candidatus Micrarchaeaceae archaeon]
MLKDYLIEIFEPTLLFGLLCSSVGLFAAVYFKVFNLYLGLIAILGVIIVQIAVNLIDDYVDYDIGIDKETKKTKFSGGSSLVVDKKVTTKNILIIAIIALLISGLLGLYIIEFLNSYVINFIILSMIFGFIATVFYARYLTHVPYFAEPFVSLSFAYVGLAVFIVATNNFFNSLELFFFVFIPSGMQVGVAMIANELPDRKIDKKYGRRNTVIMFSNYKKSGILYIIYYLIVYSLIFIGMISGVLPLTFLITLLVLPGIYKVWKGINNYKNPESHEKIMGINAITAFLFIALLSLSFIV